MKSIVLILPGLFDVPLEQLKGLSPIEKAQCPNLDEIARLGQWIRVQPPVGGLEYGLLELFGLDSEKTHLSLSSLQVYFKRFPFKPHQTSFLFQFVTLYEEEIINQDPSLLKQNELELFCADLNEYFGSWVHFLPFSQSSGVAVFNDPFREKEEPKPHPKEKNYQALLPSFFKSKEKLEKLESLHQYLKTHPLNLVKQDFEEPQCNGLLFKNGGAPLNAIVSKKFYQRFCLYSPSPASMGLANLLEVETIPLEKDSNFTYLNPLIDEVRRAIEVHPIVLLELDEILESTLKGNLLEKIKRVEYLDKHLIKRLLEFANEQHIQLIVTPLKATDIEKRVLTEEAVPWVVYHPQHKKSLTPILSFKEKELTRIQGGFSIRNLAAQFLY